MPIRERPVQDYTICFRVPSRTPSHPLCAPRLPACPQFPEIAFTGDTTADFLDSTCPIVADALRARVLLLELTFLDDVEVDEARGKGHMHIADFVAHAHKFQVRYAGGF